jgi:hypothetical protein
MEFNSLNINDLPPLVGSEFLRKRASIIRSKLFCLSFKHAEKIISRLKPQVKPSLSELILQMLSEVFLVETSASAWVEFQNSIDFVNGGVYSFFELLSAVTINHPELDVLYGKIHSVPVDIIQKKRTEILAQKMHL